MTILSFKDLNAWKEAHKLVLLIYKKAAIFPKHEEFVLSNQIRRCVVSVSSNIAEGFSRQSQKEKIQFYFTAKGSLTELENQVLIAKDLNYISIENYEVIIKQIETVGKLLTGLIKSVRDR